MPFPVVRAVSELQIASSKIRTWFIEFIFHNDICYSNSLLIICIAQSAGALENTDCTSAEG